MGLAQRRLAEQIKTEQYPPFLADIQAAAGKPIPVEIDWVSFSSYDNYPLTRMADNVFEPLLTAVKDICRDDMGRMAFQENVDSIRVKNTNVDKETSLLLDNRVLDLVVQLADGGGTYMSYGSQLIIEFLEERL
jgi:hypothetical protein